MRFTQAVGDGGRPAFMSHSGFPEPEAVTATPLCDNSSTISRVVSLRSAWSLKESRVLVRFDAGCEDAVFLSALDVASRASGAAVVGGFRVGRVELIAVGDAVIGVVPSRSTSDRPPVTRVPLPLGRADLLAAREGSTGARIRRTTKAMETKAPISAAMAKCTNFGTDTCAGNFRSPRLALPPATDSVWRGPKKASVSPLVHLFISVRIDDHAPA